MKIRLKGNSLRVRLTKSEVAKLASARQLVDKTRFPGGELTYTLSANELDSHLKATFVSNEIVVFIPRAFAKEWPDNDIIGIDWHIQIDENESLYVLLEKDFICLDETTEDQSDNYENPNKAC
jgi:hypothetical protein